MADFVVSSNGKELDDKDDTPELTSRGTVVVETPAGLPENDKKSNDAVVVAQPIGPLEAPKPSYTQALKPTGTIIIEDKKNPFGATEKPIGQHIKDVAEGAIKAINESLKEIPIKREFPLPDWGLQWFRKSRNEKKLDIAKITNLEKLKKILVIDPTMKSIVEQRLSELKGE